MRLAVHDLIGEYGITLDEGQAVYDHIYPELRGGRPVELDFCGVQLFASPFFTMAVGQLFRDIPYQTIERCLNVVHLTEAGDQILRMVIENAKRYYADPAYAAAVDGAIERYACSR